MNKNIKSIEFVNDLSKKLFDLKEHALLGISPFNSYYSEDNLKKLFSWGLNHFKEISVFIPDKISSYTLEALGYPNNRAKKKQKNKIAI